MRALFLVFIALKQVNVVNLCLSSKSEWRIYAKINPAGGIMQVIIKD